MNAAVVAREGAAASGVILFDGECGLCDRIVQFILPRDRRRAFRFAPLQGDYGQHLLAAHGRPGNEFSTMYVLTADGRLLERSAAMFHVLQTLGGGWAVLAALRVLPRRLTDWGYGHIARRRLRFFGRLATCRVPAPGERDRFIS